MINMKNFLLGFITSILFAIILFIMRNSSFFKIILCLYLIIIVKLLDKNNKKIYESRYSKIRIFENWLDKVLEEEIPKKVRNINFNLYEEKNNKWFIELIGSRKNYKDDIDWACCEDYTTRDNIYVFNEESNRRIIEEIFTNKIKKYLECGKYSNKLKNYDSIGIGFVDGDITIIFEK